MRGTIPAVRRLPRILLNAATGVSLVLCAAAVVLWVRSYRVTHSVGFPAASGNPVSGMVASRGALFLYYVRNSTTDPQAWEWRVTDGLPPTHGLTIQAESGARDLHTV